jgi:polyphosphate kinase 2 (PPK2 family)
MLETINLGRKMSHREYEQALPALQLRLYDLERACWQSGVASIVLFEGWDAAGKGGCVSALTQRLDPRGFKLYAVNPPRTFEQGYPWLWRSWLKIPSRGEMVILDRSWYRRVLDEHAEKTISARQRRAAIKDIVEFERTLSDDGIVIIKFFLHISKKEQKSRFRRMEEDPLESWRITKQDWRRHKRYNDYYEAVEEVLEVTESEFAPWTIVEATSRWYARAKVFGTLIPALETRLGKDAPQRTEAESIIRKDADLRAAMSTLEPEETVP